MRKSADASHELAENYSIGGGISSLPSVNFFLDYAHEKIS
jgi:hypothetical protein